MGPRSGPFDDNVEARQFSRATFPKPRSGLRRGRYENRNDYEGRLRRYREIPAGAGKDRDRDCFPYP